MIRKLLKELHLIRDKKPYWIQSSLPCSRCTAPLMIGSLGEFDLAMEQGCEYCGYCREIWFI